MLPVHFIMITLLAMPWLLTAAWFAFTNRRHTNLLVVTVSPWFLAMFALIGFHFLAQADAPPRLTDPTFFEKGVGYGYIAVSHSGLALALAANLLCAITYALYRAIHRIFHNSHHHKSP